MNTQEKPEKQERRPRGFAAMSPEKQREIARKGGKAAHEKGSAHEFTAEEARVAGRKGGVAVSKDRDHMAAIGREGGRSHRNNLRKQAETQRKSVDGRSPTTGNGAPHIDTF